MYKLLSRNLNSYFLNLKKSFKNNTYFVVAEIHNFRNATSDVGDLTQTLVRFVDTTMTNVSRVHIALF